MENSFQTSFIPKKPIISGGIISERRLPTSLFTVLSIIILIVVITSAIGLFFYKKYLVTQIDSLSSSIIKSQSSFDQGTINELDLFDKRTKTANTILKGHIILSPIFQNISDLTIPTVQYTNFDQQTSGNKLNIKMSGIASDYRSVALQADVFNNAKNRSFKNVIFSNISKDKSNYITFNIEFDVDPSLISYENQAVTTGPNLTTPINTQ